MIYIIKLLIALIIFYLFFQHNDATYNKQQPTKTKNNLKWFSYLGI
jgi:hypothetical protein